jgi:hypothetical protein
MEYIMMLLQYLNHSIAPGLVGISLIVAEAIFSPVRASQQFFCTGQMNNGWAYAAEFLDGRFTQIRWERPEQPPQVSRLTFEGNNIQGQPIYRGGLMAAVTVTLVDLSGGDVRPGSEISVGVEEWGWSRGACGLSSTGSQNGTSSSGSIAALRQDLLGVDQVRAREWLRENNFFFTQTTEHTNTRVVEQWHRDADRAIIHVTFDNGVVSEVVETQ